ncbi:MAG: peptidylprolyl isomerase [Chitinophagaceae bacterium]|nr:peptidylprolyl isomerase [Chitinophagaceae bacterium]MCW5929850.1 peptidylprolyl isomerase [Chitinophagaceae bacterium]
MSIIQTIRDKAAVFVFTIIGLSLIGFLVQDAFVGRTGNFFNSPETTVGKVNGVSIDRAEYDERVRNREAQYQAAGYRIEEVTRQQIYEEIWNALVSKELIESETNKLGLSFTSKEFANLLFSDNAPQEFKQQFTDPNTGVYNIEAARNAFRTIQKSKDAQQIRQVNEQLIDPIIFSQLQNKLLELYSGSVYLPKWLVEKQHAENESLATLNFVGLSFITVPDSSVKISDAAVNEYIQNHKEQFKQERSRSIAYVTFDASPNKKDSTELWDKIAGLKQQFAEAKDPGIFVTRNGTKSPFFDGYINRSRIQVPQKDSILGLSQGEVFGPYFDGNSVALARVIDSKVLPDSVKARHILIALNDPQTGEPLLADSTAKNRIDSIQRVIAGGSASFETMVIQYSDDLGSKQQFGDLGYFANGQMVKEFNDFCFEGKRGDKGVVKTQFGYHYIEIQDQKNFEQAYKIAYLSKTIEASRETDEAASGAATLFASTSRTAKAFEDNIKKDSLDQRVAENIRVMDYQVPGLGVSRSFIKWVYENKPGTVSEPISVGDQYVVALVTGEKAEGTLSASDLTTRIMVEPILREKEKAKQLVQKFGTYASLEEAAQKTGQEIQQIDSLHFSDSFKPLLGNEPKVIGASFNTANESKPSAPLTGNGGVYVVQTRISAGSGGQNNTEDQRKATMMQMKQMQGYGMMDALRRSAEIKDNRLKAGY